MLSMDYNYFLYSNVKDLCGKITTVFLWLVTRRLLLFNQSSSARVCLTPSVQHEHDYAPKTLTFAPFTYDKCSTNGKCVYEFGESGCINVVWTASSS